MVATAVSAIIVVGALMLMTYVITAADDNRDKTVATLEVQYVGFWINEDIAQAQIIQLGDYAGDPDGFPLTIYREEWDGAKSMEITYYLEEMENGETLRMMRQHDIYVNGEYDAFNSGVSKIAEYLVPWSAVNETGTRCCRMEYETQYDTMKSVNLQVYAKADTSEADTSYEVYPRAVVEWQPQDTDGYYVGTQCPGD